MSLGVIDNRPNLVTKFRLLRDDPGPAPLFKPIRGRRLASPGSGSAGRCGPAGLAFESVSPSGDGQLLGLARGESGPVFV